MASKLEKLAERVEKNTKEATKPLAKVSQYIGTYLTDEVKEASDLAIQHLRLYESAANKLQYVNHRSIRGGSHTEVWLSNYTTEFTVNAN